LSFLPFVHEVSSLTYCQGHLGILVILRGNAMVIYNNWSRIVALHMKVALHVKVACTKMSKLASWK